MCKTNKSSTELDLDIINTIDDHIDVIEDIGYKI